MAKTKKRPPVDDITLYDIDPAFQDKLISWLSKKPHGVIVDIGATDDAFKLTFDPGGETINASFEDALNEAMGSRSRTKHIDPQLEERVHKFLRALSASMTFGASKDGVFNMVVSNDQARGVASDEDFEIALVLAEEQFWANMPARPLPAAKRAALAQALVPAAQREAEREAQIEEMLPPGMAKWALGQPTMARSPDVKTAEEEQRDAALEMLPAGMHGLVKNGMGYSEWVGDVNDTLERRGYSFYDAQVAYWRQLYQAGFGPQQAAEEFETMWLAERGYAGNKKRPPPAPSSKPFDPEVPPVRYAKPHHFAVNNAWKETHPYAQWVWGLDDALRRRGGWRLEDQSPAYWRTRYEAMMHPEEAVDSFYNEKRQRALGVGEGRPEAGAIGYNEKGYTENAHPMAAGMGHHGVPRGQRAQRATSGAWRVHVAGGDIDPQRFGDYDDAAQHARSKYGPGGWQVEWASV